MGLMVTESEKSKHDMLRAMRKHIRENGITDFTDFQDWCDENNDCWSLALDSGLSPVIEKYIDGVWCVFHAMVPPTKKFKRELGWR